MHINITAHRAVGGAFFRALRTLFLLSFFVVGFFLSACEKELFNYAELQAYHAESLNLTEVSSDSINSFATKVNHFVIQNPAAKDNPLYHQILQNINTAVLTISVGSNGWADDRTITF